VVRIEEGDAVSVKRALSVLALAIAAGGVGSAVIVGTSAAGAPLPEQSLGVTPPVAVAPNAQAAPQTSLHLPTTLHLKDRTTSTVAVNKSHLVVHAALSRKHHPAGGAVYTCALSAGRVTSCRAAFALADGIFLGRLGVKPDGSFKGTITGGSGAYAGASGTAKLVLRKSGPARLTIEYSTS
jgi:hypothetical protein